MSTKRNQEQIKELSEVTDLMIIIGSFTSANSKRLAELSSVRNKNTFQVTCAAEIDSSWFKDDVNSVGISAGASTPDWIIESVIKKVKEIAVERFLRVACVVSSPDPIIPVGPLTWLILAVHLSSST